MEKNIKDYLHLHIGCEVVSMDGGKMVYILAGIDSDGTPLFKTKKSGFNQFLSSWKLAVRPLNDMRREEKIEIVTSVTYNHVRFSSDESALGCFDEDKYKNKIARMEFYADEVKYLLSKHFDLFGLIPAGLAIDKTTLKTN